MNVVSVQRSRRPGPETKRRKIAVSIPEPLVEAAQAAVRDGAASSVSAYVSQAIAEKVERDDLEAVLDAMDAKHGPPTAEDEAWARRVLGL
jgi:Arc/MetJ-type ribon-helix-helix transcriptional regulator